ncbi:MAG TPA: extracellular solute-binding protein [Mobilitalea sp.]|nr:extracellular solute-binding protein [Mobilitalea sp.]
MKKSFISVVMVLALCITSFTGCGKQTEDTSNTGSTVAPTAAGTQEAAVTTAPTVTEEPAMDLGGMEIVIGDWWSPAEEAAPTTAKEEATQAYHKMIQEKYNFKMKQVAVADWGTMQETFTTGAMAGTPAAQVFLLGQSWVAQPLANGLLYDLSTLKNFDFTQSKWNQAVIGEMTFGNSIYGMASGKAEPKLGVFWNKRLYQEAGLDPNLPYDLQASGDWTWDKFEELSKQLTIDTNNDGTPDTYATASFSADFFAGAIYSNDARYIGRDANGKFYNATTEPNFLESAQWVVNHIQSGYEMPAPEGANWDWFVAAFHDAKVAMTFAEEYKVGTWADMKDDWGFVLCPKGTKSNNNYETYFNDNIAVIPSCYDAETAAKIAFAYNLWTNPTPGYEDDAEAWKDSYYTKFRDERAVDETLTMMYDTATVNTEYSPFVYGVDLGNFLWDTYALTKTPQEKIDEVTGIWQSLIDDANK